MNKKIILVLLLLGLNACTFYKEIPVVFPDGTSLQVRVADSYKKQERAWLGKKSPFKQGCFLFF